MSSTLPKIAVIGVGNMMKSIIIGLLKKGYQPEQFLLSSPSLNKNYLDNNICYSTIEIDGVSYHLPTTKSNQEALNQADIVFLGFKPYQIEETLPGLRLNPKSIVFSVLAGTPFAVLKHHFGYPNNTFYRSMPNTGSQVEKGTGGHVCDDDSVKLDLNRDKLVKDCLMASGCQEKVANETEIDMVTATSGSGIAYFFLLFECIIKANPSFDNKNTMLEFLSVLQSSIENNEEPIPSHHHFSIPMQIVKAFCQSMENGSENLGLRKSISTDLVRETAIGAISLVRAKIDEEDNNNKENETKALDILSIIEKVRQAVTSKAGTTAAALDYYIKPKNDDSSQPEDLPPLEEIVQRLIDNPSEENFNTFSKLSPNAMQKAFKRAQEIGNEAIKNLQKANPSPA